MAAGTSEPALAETPSPLSAALSSLSRGDIQPEPGAAEDCGEGTIIGDLSTQRTACAFLSCRRTRGQKLRHCARIVTNPLKHHQHAYGCLIQSGTPRGDDDVQ